MFRFCSVMTRQKNIPLLQHAVSVVVITALFLLTTAARSAAQLCSSPMTVSKDTNIIVIQNVSETSLPNTVLRRLEIVGNDSQIRLQLSTVNDYIRFNTSSRELVVIKSFNVTGGTPMYLTLNITCASTAGTFVLQVIIQIFDMNNNPPLFVNLPYLVSITERTPIDAIVFDGVKAMDADPSDRGYLLYSVEPNDNLLSSYFSFPVSTVGNVVLMKQLDYETVQQFNLTITVKDNGNNLTILGQLQPQHTATTTLIINVVPADDYNPLFNQSIYTGDYTVDAQSSSGATEVLSVGASIKYSKPDERLTYSIVQDPDNVDASYFVIDNQTGVITVSSSNVPQLVENFVAFQVQATRVNQSYRYGRALVKVNIIKSTNPLSFTQRIYSTSLNDATPNGTLVLTVTAVNGRSRLTYQFDEEVIGFVIDSGTGEIRTTGNLSYKTLYNLSVTADDTKYTAICRVILTVIKPNAGNPQFKQQIYNFNVSKASSFVGHTTATDEDPDTVLTYRLIDNSDCFRVDGNGTIYCSCSWEILFPNSTSGASHSLLLTAEDDGQPARQGSTLVVVTWNVPSGQEMPTEGQQLSVGERDKTRAYYIAVIVLGVATGLFLLIVIILAICLCRRINSKVIPPRVTIEVDRSSQKPQNFGSQGSRKPEGGFEVTKEYGPYFSYGSGNIADDIITHSASVLNSTDKLQKLKIYHSVPAQRTQPPIRNVNPEDLGTNSQQSNASRKQFQSSYHVYSSSSMANSSPPSSRVERYQFEDDLGRGLSNSLKGPRSASSSSQFSSHNQVSRAAFNSAPGPRRGSRLQTTVATLKDSNSGDTSSTETLMTPVTSRAPKASNVSFVENTGGYLSSQEGMDASMSALTRPEGDTGITVYY